MNTKWRDIKNEIHSHLIERKEFTGMKPAEYTKRCDQMKVSFRNVSFSVEPVNLKCKKCKK